MDLEACATPVNGQTRAVHRAPASQARQLTMTVQAASMCVYEEQQATSTLPEDNNNDHLWCGTAGGLHACRRYRRRLLSVLLGVKSNVGVALP